MSKNILGVNKKKKQKQKYFRYLLNDKTINMYFFITTVKYKMTLKFTKNKKFDWVKEKILPLLSSI